MINKTETKPGNVRIPGFFHIMSMSEEYKVSFLFVDLWEHFCYYKFKSVPQKRNDRIEFYCKGKSVFVYSRQARIFSISGYISVRRFGS